MLRSTVAVSAAGVVLALAVVPFLVAAEPSAAPAQWTPEKGDHIVLVGNALAERMQHDGWLEAYFQTTFPDRELVFRNMGFAGDRVDKRPRNQGFMSPDDYLTRCEATVVFGFFGYNESYDKNPNDHQKKLEAWIDQTRTKNYSGKGAPKIVLLSPIAHEDLGDPNLPDVHESNARLAAYTEATRRAAQAKGVPFVDLYVPTLSMQGHAKEPLTTNGIHPTSYGNRIIAEQILEQITGKKPTADAALIERVRLAAVEKNWFWFNRYRATDGNDIWGNRADLRFTEGQTNRVVLQRELEQLDVMTANRDKRVQALAQGKADYKIDDSNVPPSIQVKTNFSKPQQQGGKSKTGTEVFLTPDETLKSITFEKGMKGNVFASEEMFGDVMANPVQLGVDTKGRLWAATWKTYPKPEPTGKEEDYLVILPDENRDGVADKAIKFAQVNNPTGFEFWNGGVIVVSAPDILYLKDTDGDDVADVRIRILHGIDSADTHHTANNLVYGPDGWIYYQRGVFHVSNVETPWQTNQTSGTSGMYRFNPRTFEFSFHVDNGPNPHGISFDYWGYHYITDGTGGTAWQVVPNGKGGFGKRELLKKTVRPVPSSGVLSSAHFPEANNGNFLILNAIGFLGIKQYKLNHNADNGEVSGAEVADLLVSSDGNFRPTDFEIGNDGALYVSDWQNPIIGHMQHNIRDPMRDHKHGRIFRVTVEGRPLADAVAVDGEPIDKLLDLLKHPINGIRQRARVELSERDTKQVLAAAAKWIAQFDPAKKEDAHHLLEGLWLYQQHNVVNKPLLEKLLNSPEPHARNAARRVQQMWGTDRTRPVVAEGEGVPEIKLPMTPDDELRKRGFTDAQIKQYKHGAEVYKREAHCVTCHQADGKGLANLYPPLDPKWVGGDEERLTKIVLKGLWGELTVDGVTYNGKDGKIVTPPMTPMGLLLNDEDAAAVLTYVRNTFGNAAKPVELKTVERIRNALPQDKPFYTVEEILKLHPFADDELARNGAGK